jgi:macrolide transport system ATP-binding/permease protein
LLAILAQLNASGATIVLVTHDLAIARNARRILYIIDGRVVTAEQYRELRG